jgi:DNA adenine methylase
MQAAATRVPNPLKWHGGKYYLAKDILALMPPHQNYVEAYAGGLSVLLAKDPVNTNEIVNDKFGHLTNFWSVLQSPVLFEPFCRLVEATPFSEVEWRRAEQMDVPDNPVLSAARFFIRCRQSMAGRMDCFAPVTTSRLRGGKNEQVSAWLTAVKGLPQVAARLKQVLILNRDALDVIRDYDKQNTLYYLDPPYLAETRTAPNVYEHEMTREQHAELLDLICQCQARVMISGYHSSMYHTRLSNWNWHEFVEPNHSGSSKEKEDRTEVVWCNF